MIKNIALLVLVLFFMGCEDTSPPPILGNDPAVSDPEYNFYRFTVKDTTGT